MIKRCLRLIVLSLGIVGIIAILGLLFGLITQRRFDVQYMFVANFFVGVLVVGAGIFYMFIPSSMMKKGDKLFDHTTFAERSYKARERRQKKATTMLIIGIMMVLFAGLFELIIHVIF